MLFMELIKMILLHCIHDFTERINCLKRGIFTGKKKKKLFSICCILYKHCRLGIEYLETIVLVTEKCCGNSNARISIKKSKVSTWKQTFLCSSVHIPSPSLGIWPKREVNKISLTIKLRNFEVYYRFIDHR